MKEKKKEDTKRNGIKSLADKLKDFLKTLVFFILNPRFLICFGIAWLITNGWSYVLLGIGTFCGIGWMVALSSTYLTCLWFPFTPEKLVTVIIAIALLRVLFPKDERTLGILLSILGKIKSEVKEKRDTRRRKREEKKNRNKNQGRK